MNAFARKQKTKDLLNFVLLLLPHFLSHLYLKFFKMFSDKAVLPGYPLQLSLSLLKTSYILRPRETVPAVYLEKLFEM